MRLLYPEEHLSCVNYRLDKSVGFRVCSLPKGEIFQLLDKNMNYIIFLQSGKMKFTFKEVDGNVLYSGDMVYIAPNHEGKGFAEDDVNFVVLGFDNENFQLCDEYPINSLSEHANPLRKKALVTPIYPPMQMVLESVKFYLENKISCAHLHQMKQKEIFLILRTFYSKKENADFFAPLFVS